MIKFPCHCSHPFVLEDDMAGGLVQCPRCGRLNDIPALSDLNNLNPDGTVKIDAVLPVAEPNRVETLRRSFSKSKVDEDGNEIDLIRTPEEIDRIGDDPIDIIASQRPAPPKYDPVTGERIRPMDIRQDDTEQGVVPIARRAVDYSTVGLEPSLTTLSIVGQLLMPLNIVVMIFILLAHAFLHLAIIVTFTGFLLVAPILILIVIGIVAHYGNVIDDTGPGLHDELPRPLRQCEFSTDLWAPFGSVMTGLFLCYGPSVFALTGNFPLNVRIGLAIALFVLGTLAAPAVLLTTNTSGSAANLRPDRLWGVIRQCGLKYLSTVFIWVFASIIYLGGLVLTMLFLTNPPPSQYKWLSFLTGPASYPLLFFGIVLMHLFCWQLGHLYRQHHAHFPWVMQRHIYKNRTTLPPRRAKKRHVPPQVRGPV